MIRFLIKGLIRDRSRSLFPIITVLIGAMLTVILYSWINGAISNVIESSANFTAGHVKVMSRAYGEEADRIPNDLAYIGVRKLILELSRDYPDLIWAPRIRFRGLLDIPDSAGETRAQGPIVGIAVDLRNESSPEKDLLNLESALVRGNLPMASGEILLSDMLAKEMGIEPGQLATLISVTMYGSMVIHNFKVSGTLNFGVTAMDRGSLLADIADIQEALDMDDASGEILGFFRDFLYLDKEADKIETSFNKGYENVSDEFAPRMTSLRHQGGLSQTLDFANLVYTIVIVLFVTVMSVVLWNAGLMGSLRRYHEFGIRLALGEDKTHLYRSLIAESLIIGFVGSILGTILGLAVSYYMQKRGLNIGPMMKNASMIISDTLRARITPVSFFIGFIPGLFATFTGKAISGIGIYKRQTSQLTKEFES